MCDSISFIAFIDEGIATEVYDQCAYPDRTQSDAVYTSANFRTEYCTSPLTGAQFRVTPLGELVNDEGTDRYQYGRVAAYLVEVNIPATVIGHTRLLVNGVRAALRVGLPLLKFWLAQNGCTRKGLELIRLEKALIVDLTLTFLYRFKSEEEARAALYDFRTYTEAVLNKPDTGTDDEVKKKQKRQRKVAYSIPEDPVRPISDKTYTSYVRQREYLLSAYVKERDQPGAFMLPIEDTRCEVRLDRQSLQTLRVEVRVHGKWLKDNELHTFDGWKDDPEAYKKVFNLLRQTLRLDEGMRTKRLKKTSVSGLKLSASDQSYLLQHLDGASIRQHADFLAMLQGQFSSRYSALRKRIFEKTDGIDLDLPYAVQSRLSASLSELLVFPGEFVPDEELAGYLFSRVSVPYVTALTNAMVDEVLEAGSACVFAQPQYTVYRGPDRPKTRHPSGIGNAPLLPNWNEE